MIRSLVKQIHLTELQYRGCRARRPILKLQDRARSGTWTIQHQKGQKLHPWNADTPVRRSNVSKNDFQYFSALFKNFQQKFGMNWKLNVSTDEDFYGYKFYFHIVIR